MSKNDGGPAFANMTANSCGPVNPRREGMSLRDWFAGQALQSLAGSDTAMGVAAGHDAPEKWIAGTAYAFADAMIAERSK